MKPVYSNNFILSKNGNTIENTSEVILTFNHIYQDSTIIVDNAIDTRIESKVASDEVSCVVLPIHQALALRDTLNSMLCDLIKEENVIGFKLSTKAEEK